MELPAIIEQLKRTHVEIFAALDQEDLDSLAALIDQRSTQLQHLSGLLTRSSCAQKDACRPSLVILLAEDERIGQEMVRLCASFGTECARIRRARPADSSSQSTCIDRRI